jgi:hypothetical protein
MTFGIHELRLISLRAVKLQHPSPLKVTEVAVHAENAKYNTGASSMDHLPVS